MTEHEFHELPAHKQDEYTQTPDCPVEAKALWYFDDDALTVTKAGLAGIVAALKKNVARVKIDSERKTIATDGISVCNPPKEA